MHGHGYDTYLLHAVRAKGAYARMPARMAANASRNPAAAAMASAVRLTLVPVSGAFWRPELDWSSTRSTRSPPGTTLDASQISTIQNFWLSGGAPAPRSLESAFSSSEGVAFRPR